MSVYVLDEFMMTNEPALQDMAASTLCASTFALPRYRYCLSPMSSFTTAKLPSALILQFICSLVPYSVVMHSIVSIPYRTKKGAALRIIS